LYTAFRGGVDCKINSLNIERIHEEKVVIDPQRPVVSPTYKGR